MTIINITELTYIQKQDVMRLWNNEYPVQMAYANVAALDAYLDALAGKMHFLLLDGAGATHGWALTFTRDNERWFAIIVSAALHGQGYGSMLLRRLMEHEPVLNGWVTSHGRYTKLNGAPYKIPLRFYLKNGFTVTGARLTTDVVNVIKIVWKRAGSAALQ